METHLTIKHLAGYLPYGLKFKRKDYIYIHTLLGISFEDIVFELGKTPIKFIKPILRPLSDLTKEIEVNEEKFVPTERFNKIRKWEGSPLAMTEHIIHNVKEHNLPTWITQKLLEWHFDIYGLIENGLAIDINTLNK